jgi:chemotaxis protein MotB
MTSSHSIGHRARRRRPPSDTHGAATHDRWLLSYSDFVTLLLAVFIVLFGFAWKQKQPLRSFTSAVESGLQAQSSVPNEQQHAAAAMTTPEPAPYQRDAKFAAAREQLYRDLRTILGNSIDRGDITIKQTPEGVVVSLRELGFFGSAQASLLPEASEKLGSAAKFLVTQNSDIRIEGHSDDQPIHTALFQSNWELSVARAMSVMRLLVNDDGFPENKVSVAGYGPFRPVASNSTPAGRQANRRVDLVIVPGRI